jgi:hypothetical protein
MPHKVVLNHTTRATTQHHQNNGVDAQSCRHTDTGCHMIGRSSFQVTIYPQLYSDRQSHSSPSSENMNMCTQPPLYNIGLPQNQNIDVRWRYSNRIDLENVIARTLDRREDVRSKRGHWIEARILDQSAKHRSKANGSSAVSN